MHAAPDIALGDRNHQTEVCLDHFLFGGFLSLAHAPGQVDFLLGGQEGHVSDLLQVHAHGVVGSRALGILRKNLDILDLYFLDAGEVLRLLCGAEVRLRKEIGSVERILPAEPVAVGLFQNAACQGFESFFCDQTVFLHEKNPFRKELGKTRDYYTPRVKTLPEVKKGAAEAAAPERMLSRFTGRSDPCRRLRRAHPDR